MAGRVDVADAGHLRHDTATAADVAAQPAGAYRYIRVAEGDNASIEECVVSDETPGADVDAVGLFRNGEAVAYCADIEWFSGAGLDKPSCEGKDPSAAHHAAAAGPPDACTRDFTVPECPVLESDKWIWLNGGEIVCDLGAGAAIMPGDMIVVYEVFNPSKPDSVESYFLSVAEDEHGPWVDLGKGVGVAPILVPEL